MSEVKTWIEQSRNGISFTTTSNRKETSGIARIPLEEIQEAEDSREDMELWEGRRLIVEMLRKHGVPVFAGLGALPTIETGYEVDEAVVCDKTQCKILAWRKAS